MSPANIYAMPMQRTFTLIPNSPAPHLAQHARPMTTKQVRKAYKASTKPPMSRAEQKKQERAEQERIRKEFEKQKAAARAKLAREKKREKELAEREQKKKLGMPLVTVRPSQDTIARFIRGNASAHGKKRNFRGEPLEEVRKESNAVKDTKSEAAINHNRPELDLIPEEDERELEKFLDTITNSISAREAHGKAHVKQDTRPQEKHPLEQQSPPTPRPHKQPNRSPKSPKSPLRSTGEMKPPPRLQQPKPPQPIHSPPPAIQQPPMSTQAILGNLDDFFPSSSQQALELQDETPSNMPDDSSSEIESPTPPQKQHPPRRFFTSSGSNEIMSLAIQRSKRTAAMEELKHPEIAQAQHPKATAACNPDYSINTILPPKPFAGITKPPSFREDTNIQTETSVQACAISDSQETEYGGDWMDELASDLIV